MHSIRLIIDLSKTKDWSKKSKIVSDAIIKTIGAVMPHRPMLNNRTCLVSVRMTNNKEIRKINKEFRNKDQPTNVLSFQTIDWNGGVTDEMPIELISPTRDTSIYQISHQSYESIKISDISGNTMVLNIGDIMLSYEQILTEAEEQKKDFDQYIKFITIHGILHLLGYDHQFEDEATEMANMERTIMEK